MLTRKENLARRFQSKPSRPSTHFWAKMSPTAFRAAAVTLFVSTCTSALHEARSGAGWTQGAQADRARVGCTQGMLPPLQDHQRSCKGQLMAKVLQIQIKDTLSLANVTLVDYFDG